MLSDISFFHSLTSGTRLFSKSPTSMLAEIDWIREIRLVLSALFLGSIIVFLIRYVPDLPPDNRLTHWVANLLRMFSTASTIGRARQCARPENPNDPTRRIIFTTSSAAIYAWPSRGGVIILNDATHVDLIFLGLSTTEPPLRRGRGEESTNEADQDVQMAEEDAFCQRLLLLGAKWWDDEARYRLVSRIGGGDQPAVAMLEDGTIEEPTLRERRWVKVGWEGEAPSKGRGDDDGDGSHGLWVLDCDTNMYGIVEEENMVPDDAGRLNLARSMEERCEILKGMGARFFGGVKEYESRSTFLRAWGWKWEGEVGELVKVS